MANPQTEDGYIRISRELMHAFVKSGLSGSEFMILLAVITKTYGWNKKEDKISLSQFQKLTCMPKSRCIRAIKNLVSWTVLGSIIGDTSTSSTYWIIKDYEKWNIPPSVMRGTRLASIVHDTTPSIIHDKKLVSPMIPTINNNNKQLKTRDFEFLKNPIFKESFEHFIHMRKEIKKKLTSRGQELILIKLHKENVEVATAMLNQSIERSWAGVFPVKKELIANKIMEGF